MKMTLQKHHIFISLRVIILLSAVKIIFFMIQLDCVTIIDTPYCIGQFLYVIYGTAMLSTSDTME